MNMKARAIILSAIVAATSTAAWGFDVDEANQFLDSSNIAHVQQPAYHGPLIVTYKDGRVEQVATDDSKAWEWLDCKRIANSVNDQHRPVQITHFRDLTYEAQLREKAILLARQAALNKARIAQNGSGDNANGRSWKLQSYQSYGTPSQSSYSVGLNQSSSAPNVTYDTQPSTPSGLINTANGQYYPAAAGGYTNPTNGTFMQSVAGGVINTRTGQFSPTH